MRKLTLDRPTLAKVLQGNQLAIVTFERILKDVGETLPGSVEEANALAGAALAVAQANGAILALLMDALEQLDAAPAATLAVDLDDTAPVAALAAEVDDTAPRSHLGTLAAQNADAVEITGGTIALDAGTTALPALSFTTDRASGLHQPAAGQVAIVAAGSTILRAAGDGVSVAGNVLVDGIYVQTGKNAPGCGGQVRHRNDAGTLHWLAGLLGSVGAVNYTIYDLVSGSPRLTISAANGGVALSNGFGCNGRAPQLSAALGPGATDLPSVITLTNTIRAALIANGIGS